MALIENIQREDLNPSREAVALQRLQQEFRTHPAAGGRCGQQVAGECGEPAARLIALPDEIKPCSAMVIWKWAMPGVVRLPLKTSKWMPRVGCCRPPSTYVRPKPFSGAPVMKAKETRGSRSDPDIQRLEQRLAEKLGLACKSAWQQGRGNW